MEERSLSPDLYTEVSQCVEAVESLCALGRTGLLLDSPGMGSHRMYVSGRAGPRAATQHSLPH